MSFRSENSLPSGPELSKDFYQVAPDWHWKEPTVKVWEKKDGRQRKEGRREGGDWGEVVRLPPWMWKEAGSSEKFRATGDDNLFFKWYPIAEKFRATCDDKHFAKLYPEQLSSPGSSFEHKRRPKVPLSIRCSFISRVQIFFLNDFISWIEIFFLNEFRTANSRAGSSIMRKNNERPYIPINR